MKLLMNYNVQNPEGVGGLFGSVVQDVYEQSWDSHTLFVIDLYELERENQQDMFRKINRHLQQYPHSAVSINLSHESIPTDWLDTAHKPRDDLRVLTAGIANHRIQFMLSQWDVLPNIHQHYPGANVQDVNFWETHTVQHWQRAQVPLTKPTRHIQCLNRRYTGVRAAAVMALLAKYPDATYTLGSGGSWEKYVPDSVWQHQELRLLQDEQLQNQILQWQNTQKPWRSLWNIDEWEGADIYRSTVDHAHHIVVESAVLPSRLSRTSAFITEKTFRPIVCSRRFYSIGEPHTNATLQRWGYRTYSKPKTDHWQDQLAAALELSEQDHTLHNRRNLLKRAQWQHRYSQANGVFQPYYGLQSRLRFSAKSPTAA